MNYKSDTSQVGKVKFGVTSDREWSWNYSPDGIAVILDVVVSVSRWRKITIMPKHMKYDFNPSLPN